MEKTGGKILMEKKIITCKLCPKQLNTIDEQERGICDRCLMAPVKKQMRGRG
jgi:hypothetical protein